jgi:NAD(P)-dependent dehydrogenase (short-subunit alcohol dehydrogenase family)
MRFAEEGAKVVILDKNEDQAAAVAKEIRTSTGADTLAITADVTEEAEVTRAVDRVVEQFNGIDILFNNAGTGAIRAPVYQASS